MKSSAIDDDILIHTRCPKCSSKNYVIGNPYKEFEALCRDCKTWFDPDNHPLGCFFGSFGYAYPDNWHIPRGVSCLLYHGPDPIQLL